MSTAPSKPAAAGQPPDNKPTNSCSCKKLFLYSIVLFICLAAAIYLFRVPILTAFGNFLVIQDRLEPSDIIFVLNGDVATRPFQAAKLWKEELAPKVVIVRAGNSLAVNMDIATNVTDTSIAMMKKAGIPAATIVQLPFPSGVTSTFDESRALRSYAQQNSLRRIIVVTSSIHTRRARWIIRRALAGLPLKIMMSPSFDPRYTPRNWWRQEDGFIGYQNEYLKLVYYFFKHR
jgi:uncharacterized SAM-binding protein YcdF (DUF218 family)